MQNCSPVGIYLSIDLIECRRTSGSVLTMQDTIFYLRGEIVDVTLSNRTSTRVFVIVYIQSD